MTWKPYRRPTVSRVKARKGRRKGSALSVKVLPGQPWETTAQRLGWSAADIDGLVSLLKISRDGDHVTLVDRNQITVQDNGTNALSRMMGPWIWKKSIDVQSSVALDVQLPPWCALHGDGCHPTESGCGIANLLERDVCECPPARNDPRTPLKLRRVVDHLPSCEIVAQNKPTKKTMARVATPADAPSALPVATVALVVAPVTTKPKGRRVRVLPGQASFGDVLSSADDARAK